jgi:hypothetical protein
MAGYFGPDIVKEGMPFNRAEIEGAMKRQEITSIAEGDTVRDTSRRSRWRWWLPTTRASK